MVLPGPFFRPKPLKLMSVLDRYLNTEKYQGVMRELAIAQILNEKTKPGLFIKQNALDRCGFTGDADDFPNAEADYEHVFNMEH